MSFSPEFHALQDFLATLYFQEVWDEEGKRATR
jgi:hypothetical protein